VNSVTAVAHPSLALVKYWGKQPTGVNVPATGSIGVSLEALTTTTTVTIDSGEIDTLTIDEADQSGARFTAFCDLIREETDRAGRGDETPRFHVVSENTFPTAAGLASSASGYAALTVAMVAALDIPMEDLPLQRLSAIARRGSGSAARSIFGGFVSWEAGAEEATELHPADWWPELRIVVFPLAAGKKPVSSRDAMNRTRDTSPYFTAWVTDSEKLVSTAKEAIASRDIESLGEVMRRSYLRMFATMLAADPPILYWQGNSVEMIHRVASLRQNGVPAWETMDAGPQVKVLTTAEHVDAVVAAGKALCTRAPIVSAIGGGARIVAREDAE
jgi:diphosphomevalonate decarboxylase